MGEFMMNDTTLPLVIRKPVKTDAAAMLEYLKIVGGESDNLTFGKEGHPFTVEQEEIFLEGLSKNNNQIMLLGIIDNQIVSSGSLGGSPRERLKHTMELGISVRKEYWNQGIARKIIEALFEEARKLPYLKQISLHVRADNQAAIHLYQSLGFVQTGVFPNQMHINDLFIDTLFMIKTL